MPRQAGPADSGYDQVLAARERENADFDAAERGERWQSFPARVQYQCAACGRDVYSPEDYNAYIYSGRRRRRDLCVPCVTALLREADTV